MLEEGNALLSVESSTKKKKKKYYNAQLLLESRMYLEISVTRTIT